MKEKPTILCVGSDAASFLAMQNAFQKKGYYADFLIHQTIAEYRQRTAGLIGFGGDSTFAAAIIGRDLLSLNGVLKPIENFIVISDLKTSTIFSGPVILVTEQEDSDLKARITYDCIFALTGTGDPHSQRQNAEAAVLKILIEQEIFN